MPDTHTMTTLERNCPFCGKKHSITVDSDELNRGMEAYRNGALIQNAFPNFTPSQREFILTGICDKCWKSM